jgi:hypothetical protein
VTTVRGVPLGPHEFTVKEKARSDANEIVAPRIINYQRPGQGWNGGAVNTPEKAREWVRWGVTNGLDGLKLGAEDRHHGRAARRGEEAQHGVRPPTCSRAESRR